MFLGKGYWGVCWCSVGIYELVFCVGSQVDYGQEPMQRYIALLGKLQILPDEIQGGAYPGRNSHVSRMCYVFKFAEQWRSKFSVS